GRGRRTGRPHAAGRAVRPGTLRPGAGRRGVRGRAGRAARRSQARALDVVRVSAAARARAERDGGALRDQRNRGGARVPGASAAWGQAAGVRGGGDASCGRAFGGADAGRGGHGQAALLPDIVRGGGWWRVLRPSAGGLVPRGTGLRYARNGAI
ncbi:MAG: NTP pyrophosphohydrolases including oxidative damage repair enzymes, partial [uncultured Sphingomonas sp.]